MDASKPAGGDFHRALGRRIGELRKRQQFTQAEIARVLGVSQQSVFAIEGGERRVSVDRVPVLARTFGVTADELLDIKPVRSQSKPSLSGRIRRHVELLRELTAGDRRVVLRVTEALRRQ